MYFTNLVFKPLTIIQLKNYDKIFICFNINRKLTSSSSSALGDLFAFGAEKYNYNKHKCIKFIMTNSINYYQNVLQPLY